MIPYDFEYYVTENQGVNSLTFIKIKLT